MGSAWKSNFVTFIRICLPSITVQESDSFVACVDLRASLRVVEGYWPGFAATNWTDPAKIKIDCTIKALDVVLDKQTYFDVFFFKKFEELLSCDEKVECSVVGTHLF
jgi:hypothetical protein